MFHLDPQNAAFADAIDGVPEPHEMGYIGAFDALELLQQGEAAQDITTETLEIPGSDGSTTVVIFRPKSAPSTLPMVFYLHGGGWIMGR
jgi:acetyl esterase